MFVDAGAPNYRQLIDDLMKSADQGRQIDIVVIDSDRDGIEQITEALSRYRDLDAVHIVSHGDDGSLQIGSGQLGQDTLRRFAHVVQGWGEALKPDADLMLYGCDLAGSDKGQALINDLATLTGADVAASTDLTGSALRGGDWDLEYQVGDIETDVAFSDQAQQDWTGVLAAETVRDGWLYSGDLGYRDTEGFLFIVDRAKDMILRGGENVYCTEIENCMADHPEIDEAAVIGVPDTELGERVKAIVRRIPGSKLSPDAV